MISWRIILNIIFLFTVSTFISCAGSGPTKKTSSSVELDITVNSILVLPAEISFDHEAQSQPTDANRLATGQEILDMLFAEYFSGRNDIRMMSRSEYEGLFLDVSTSQASLARETGRVMGSDGVMMSTVRRYVPRDSSKSRPASVSFDYRLLAVNTGQVLCSGVFDETQQALFDNMFSLKRAFSRKFQWISSEELAREGVIDKLDGCRYLRRGEK